jgi:hypothetical protein
MGEYLLLKWGTLKGWCVESEAANTAHQKYANAGPQSMSAMAQRDNAEQKAALCELIDAVDGEITNDWSGETLTKDAAKTYVMEYQQ